jgi:hypothetical protein
MLNLANGNERKYDERRVVPPEQRRENRGKEKNQGLNHCSERLTKRVVGIVNKEYTRPNA